MKEWNVDYSLRKDGVVTEKTITVKADSIANALGWANVLVKSEDDAQEAEYVIWNVGIMDEDVFDGDGEA